MTIEDYIAEATAMVEAWELPDSELPDAIHAQAELMAGLEKYWLDDFNCTAQTFSNSF